MGFLSLVYVTKPVGNATGLWPADMTYTAGLLYLKPVKFERPVAPGPWRLISVDYRFRKNGHHEHNSDIEQHRGVYITLRGDNGKLLFQRGGVLDSNLGFYPSTVVAHQTHHKVGNGQNGCDAFSQYQEDAVFFSDQPVSNVAIELYDTQTGKPVTDGFLNLSLCFQTPEYIL